MSKRQPQVAYWFRASADDLYRLLINEVPNVVKRQARVLLRRDPGESAAAHKARMSEINLKRRPQR